MRFGMGSDRLAAMWRILILTSFAALAMTAAASVSSDELCRATGNSAGCADTTYPSGSYRPPRERDDDGRDVPRGCPECRAEAIRRLGHLRPLQPPAWSEDDQRREYLEDLWRVERRRAASLGPLLAAKPNAPSPLPAPKPEPLPYTDADVVSSMGGAFKDVENLHNVEVLDAYRELWKIKRYRAALKLIGPVQFKAILANENGYKAELLQHCGFGKLKCGKLQRDGTRKVVNARMIGVGIAALIHSTATGDPYNLRVDAEVDERLIPAKALPAGLRLLADHHVRIVKIYSDRKLVPDEKFLWELTVISYNTSPNKFRDAISEAAALSEKSFEDVRLRDLTEVKEGQSEAILEKLLGTGKFQTETKNYLPKVRRTLPAGDPRRGE